MKTYLILFYLWIVPTLSWACSCINAGDFCTILPQAIDNGSLVVRGNPVRTVGHGMEFEIEEIVAGTELKRRIMVWGDPGYLCRVYVTGFERRDELLMILDPITRERTEATTGETEQVGDYSLSVCGQYFVYLNGSNQVEVDCYSPKAGKPTLVSVYPNPSRNSFSLINPDIELEDVTQVNVFLPNGQLLYRQGQLALRQNDLGIEIETETWVSNLYLVEIRTLQDHWLAKVLVVK